MLFPWGQQDVLIGIYLSVRLRVVPFGEENFPLFIKNSFEV